MVVLVCLFKAYGLNNQTKTRKSALQEHLTGLLSVCYRQGQVLRRSEPTPQSGPNVTMSRPALLKVFRDLAQRLLEHGFGRQEHNPDVPTARSLSKTAAVHNQNLLLC